jgi:DNA-binding transcriptional LysR family regulator
MEMAQIRYVLEAARNLNFTRAAEACRVTQPALTKAIKTLEAELGAPLFHREGKRVLLTEFGRSMLPHFDQIMQEAEATRALAQNYKLLRKVPVRLGVMSSVGAVRLARFLAEFNRRHNGVELSVTEEDLGGLEAKLDSGELDAAILNPVDRFADRYNAAPLYAERYVVVFPPEHRLGRLNAVALKDLSGEPYVDRLACELREMVTKACNESNVQLYARFRSHREDWVQAMVLAGIGFAFMPEYSVTLPGLLQRPLIDPPVERQIKLVTVPGRPFNAAVSAFIRQATAFAWPG